MVIKRVRLWGKNNKQVHCKHCKQAHCFENTVHSHLCWLAITKLRIGQMKVCFYPFMRYFRSFHQPSLHFHCLNVIGAIFSGIFLIICIIIDRFSLLVRHFQTWSDRGYIKWLHLGCLKTVTCHNVSTWRVIAYKSNTYDAIKIERMRTSVTLLLGLYDYE